jgi:hypothetical protein
MRQKEEEDENIELIEIRKTNRREGSRIESVVATTTPLYFLFYKRMERGSLLKFQTYFLILYSLGLMLFLCLP